MYKSNSSGNKKRNGKSSPAAGKRPEQGGRYTFASPEKPASGRGDKPKFGDRDWRDTRYPSERRGAPRHSESNSRVSSRFDPEEERIDSGAVVGRNAVTELIKSGRDIDKLFVLKPQDGEKPTGSVVMIVAMAVERRIPVVEVERSKLDDLADGVPHQGVAAMVPTRDYSSLDDIFALAAAKGEKPLVVIADDISDPHNLGAIIRNAEGVGAHGVIIPKRRSTSVTPVVAKASAGASSWLPIVKVANLAQTIDALKERGLWIYAAEADGVDYRGLDYDVPAALIVGSEGDGISRLLIEKSDYKVSIPMRGQVNSLNVSCAAAVLLYKMTENRTPAAGTEAGDVGFGDPDGADFEDDEEYDDEQ